MLVRVLQFLIGAALAGGGGWLAWISRDSFGSIVPPPAAGLPLVLLAGVAGVTTGLVFVVSALHPRPNRARAMAERAAEQEAALQRADAYYAERARAADRDWRASDIAPPPASAQPAAAPPPPVQPAPAAKPARPAAPVFPAQATLAPIPAAPAAPAETLAAPAIAPAAAASGPQAAIRAALAAGRMDEAERLLNAARDTATGVDLAHLTALAGDHAAACGKPSHAKWLWKLALKRFGEHAAAGTPAAQAVAESLRQAG
jgi:hypothetical protein